MKRIVYTLLFALTISAANYSFAQQKSKPTFVTTVEDIKEYKLSNGLKVLLLPDATQSNLIVNIVYNVGSKHEGYGEKGMAHLLEHMLFKSTKNLGDIKKMISDKGGRANGTTWYDRTNYYEIFAASDENLAWALQMEADRMVNATILQEDLDKEFSVVRNEFEIGENNPTGVLMERTINTAYLWHNYGLSTIGSKEDIERVKTPQLKRFYEKYYQPDNATLVIAGKFDEAKALKYIEDYFSVIPKPTRVLDEIFTVEPAQDGEKYVEVKRAGDSQHINMLYHAASFADKDYAALSALESILTNDPSGYLYKELVETKKVSSIWAFNPTVRDAGFVLFNFDVPNDRNLDTTLKDVKVALAKIGTINYTQEDLDRAKTNILKGFDGLLPPPAYFPLNVKLNKEGYENVETIIDNNKALTPREFQVLAEESGALIIDVRSAADFAAGHIPGAIFIGLDGQFAPWVGALITDIKQAIMLITPEGREEEAIIRLSRVGYDNTLGYLKGGFNSWKAEGFEYDTVQQVTAQELADKLASEDIKVVDVRKPGEYNSAHLEYKNLTHSPLDFINDNIADFPTTGKFYIHCAGGYRSLIASSILKARGYHNMIDVIGGFGAIKNTSAPIVEATCSSTCSSTAKAN